MQRGRHLRDRMTGIIADFPPSAFSIVMATGIVSTAPVLFGLPSLAWALLIVNIAAFAAIVGLSLMRLGMVPGRVVADFRRHSSTPDFFTLVAGTCVLGSQFVLVASWPMTAAILFCFAVALWLVLTYAFFISMTTSTDKPRLEESMDGTWMLLVVCTQNLSLLATLIAARFPSVESFVFGFATVTFFLGCVFYLVLFSLTLYRFLFFPFDKVRPTPPFWINMGAIATTTLTGSYLVLHAKHWFLLAELRPVLKGLTLFSWSTATWWIPLLLALGAWRHVVRKVPITYDLQYWSLVFPVGMYSVATFKLVEALELGNLVVLAHATGYCGLAVWFLTAIGLARRTIRGFAA